MDTSSHLAHTDSAAAKKASEAFDSGREKFAVKNGFAQVKRTEANESYARRDEVVGAQTAAKEKLSQANATEAEFIKTQAAVK